MKQSFFWLFSVVFFLGGATCLGTSLPSHKMQGTFLNCRNSVDFVSARALNNHARYIEVDFTRFKANVSNTARFVGDRMHVKRNFVVLSFEAY